MEKSKSLFKEFMTVSSYINYNDIYSRSEIPIKTQLQTILSNLPDEDQLAALEGDLETLKVSMDAMKFESPSMVSSVNKVREDVFLIRQKLREVVSRVSQMNRDLSYDPRQAPQLPLHEEEWKGLSSKYSLEDLVKRFGKEKIKAGAKVEMEHTKDIKLAMRIAGDHLIEDPDYYEKLAKIEQPKNESY